jgi:hypothetical protein
MINTNPPTGIEYFGVLARCKQTPQVESQRRVGCCVHRIRNDTILRPVHAIVPNGCIWLGTTTLETLWHHLHLHVLALCTDVQAKLAPLQKYSTAAGIILTPATSSTLWPLNVQATCTQHSINLHCTLGLPALDPRAKLQLTFAVAYAITFTTAAFLKSTSALLYPDHIRTFVPLKPTPTPQRWAPELFHWRTNSATFLCPPQCGHQPTATSSPDGSFSF